MNDRSVNTSSSEPTSEPPSEQKRSERGSALFLGVIVLVGVLLLAVFYYGILHPPSRRVGSGVAPEIELVTYSGETVRLSDYRGKPVVINFWASWCYTCREEQPVLEATWRRYGGKVIFLGVDYLDQEPNARAYLKEFDVTYPNGPDKASRAYTTYHVQGVPETFFVDREGILQGFYVGPIPEAELEARIQALLHPPTPTPSP